MMMNLKDPTGRLSRWALKLQQYNFTLSHRKGKNNIVPDALSRSFPVNEQNVNIPLEIETLRTANVGNWYHDLRIEVDVKPGKYPDYQIVHGRLYKHVSDRSGNGSWKMVVPDEEKGDVLQKNHDDMAHLGFSKTYKRIKSKFRWPNMKDDVRDYVKQCTSCKSSKSVNIITRPIMGRRKLAERPWQIVSIDYMGPFPKSKRGNTMTLVITDWFTKFPLIIPIRSAKSQSLCQILEEQVFFMYGVPQFLVSYNGSQFTSKLFKDLLRKYKVTHWLTSLYHPQTNPTERVNKVIIESIRSYIRENQQLWDEQVPRIACAIRSVVHESTGVTPYKANFGVEMILSGEEYEGPTHVQNDRLLELQRIRESIQRNLAKAYDRYSKQYNSHAREIVFKEGEYIWRRNFVQSDASRNFSAKLAPKFVPGIILKRTGTNTYDVGDLSEKYVGNFSAKDIIY